MEIIAIDSLREQCQTRISGIYYLYNKDKEIVYVGKSKNCVRMRIYKHVFAPCSYWQERKDIIKALLMQGEISYFSFKEIEQDLVNETEKQQILKYKPYFNNQYLYNPEYSEDDFDISFDLNILADMYYTNSDERDRLIRNRKIREGWLAKEEISKAQADELYKYGHISHDKYMTLIQDDLDDMYEKLV